MFKQSALFAVILFSCSAFAWECPTGQRQVQVPKGTPGATLHEGLWFQCQAITPPPTDPSTNNTSNSSSSASSSSASSATGGNATASGGVASVGPVTATGGAGGNVSGSGNSTNNNTNNVSATGGQGGAGGNASQTQSQTQSNSNSAVGSGNTTSVSNNTIYKQVHQVASALAPETLPTAPCTGSLGGAVQTGLVGASLGGSRTDKNCEILETAKFFGFAGSRIAMCKTAITTKAARRAGVTFEDCMQEFDKAEATPPPVQQQPQIVIVPVQPSPVASPAPVVVTPAAPAPESRLIGICTFAGKTTCSNPGSDAAMIDPARPTSVCKEMLAAARNALRDNPGSVIILRGNRNPTEDQVLATVRANNVRKQLEADGVKPSMIRTETGTGTSRTVDIVLATQYLQNLER